MSKTKMEGRSLQQRLCRKFCSYYKPSKEEALACMGYLVIEGLSNSGREMPFPAVVKNPRMSVKKLLMDRMCRRCAFYEDGCDFVCGVPGSSPCGGFAVLGHMCETSAVSVDDIEAVIGLMT